MEQCSTRKIFPKLATFHQPSLLLSGGSDIAPAYFGQEPHPALGDIDPERDAAEVSLLQRAFDSEDPMPVLAICRGIQVLNVAAGGTLIQDIPSQVPAALQHRQSTSAPVVTHTVYLTPGTRLCGILETDEIRTNTHHHQAVDRVADGFRVSARAADGIVEGLEKPDARFIVGVQCHPERLAVKYPPFQRIFDAFIAASTR